MGCPVCNSEDVKSFAMRKFSPFAGQTPKKENFSVEYFVCKDCGLIFCPEMISWSKEKFSEMCYNDGYKKYDMDIVTPNGRRQNMSFNFIKENLPKGMTNLDYGGGNGYLSDILNKNGYSSKTYDPFTKFNDTSVLNNKYDFVSCIEVLEHSYNILDVAKQISDASGGIIYVSTGIYDNVESFDKWYYFNPRVGHILLFRKKTIEALFGRLGYYIKKISIMEHEQMNILLRAK